MQCKPRAQAQRDDCAPVAAGVHIGFQLGSEALNRVQHKPCTHGLPDDRAPVAAGAQKGDLGFEVWGCRWLELLWPSFC